MTSAVPRRPGATTHSRAMAVPDRRRTEPDLYARLYEDVVAGVWDDTALVEAGLARHYGTSRTPIREALRRLEQDGLAERRDRSLRVRARSPEEILDIYDVRIALEGLAAATAAERHGVLDLARMRRAAEAMRALEPADSRAMAAANRRFHETLWDAAHSSTLVDVLRRLHDHLRRYPESTLRAPGRWAAALAQHDELVDHIEARDATGARARAEAHMTEARDIRLRMFSDE
ncbi:MAG TPA: GntR family transcriptional regulator [Solirubrobacteraceae bacterium]